MKLTLGTKRAKEIINSAQPVTEVTENITVLQKESIESDISAITESDGENVLQNEQNQTEVFAVRDTKVESNKSYLYEDKRKRGFHGKHYRKNYGTC